ncbi:MAG: cytochrome c oxidase subunit 3 [Bacteroidia bacterium]
MAEHLTVDPKALIEGERPGIFNASYGKLMMWFFLMSDAFTFSSLLIAYGALRVRSGAQAVPWADPEGVFTHTPVLYDVFHKEAPLVFVGIMTFILILSSVTMVLAVEAGHRNSKPEVAKWMLWTVAGGLAFVLCQGYEWYHFIEGHPEGAYKISAQMASKVDLSGYDEDERAEILRDGLTVVLVAEPGVMSLKDYNGKVLTRVTLDNKGNVAERFPAQVSGAFISKVVPEMEKAKANRQAVRVETLRAIAKENGADEIYGLLEGATYTAGGANMKVNEYGPPAFANLFFFVTGFHGTHVFSGVVLNFIIFLNVIKGTYERRGHYEMVEKVGLYWHFVDLVWVFVFTFFYLV